MYSGASLSLRRSSSTLAIDEEVEMVGQEEIGNLGRSRHCRDLEGRRSSAGLQVGMRGCMIICSQSGSGMAPVCRLGWGGVWLYEAVVLVCRLGWEGVWLQIVWGSLVKVGVVRVCRLGWEGVWLYEAVVPVCRLGWEGVWSSSAGLQVRMRGCMIVWSSSAGLQVGMRGCMIVWSSSAGLQVGMRGCMIANCMR